MKRNTAPFMPLLVVLLTAGFAARSDAGSQIDPQADQIFKASCKYLADAKSFSFKVEVWKDVELQSGVKLQTTRNLEVQHRRPGQLRIELRSPRVSRGFWYENGALTMLDRIPNLYGQIEAPETLDKTIDVVEERFGVEIPLCDVLVADPYRNLMDNMETLTYLGKVTVLGVACDHLLFTGPNADCQVWIADGAKPLPRKVAINFKAAKPVQLTQIFNDWDLVTPISDSVFKFVPPAGALKIAVETRRTEAAPPSNPAEAPSKQ